jgi:hypothetical protein
MIEAEEGRAWITAPPGSDADAQIAAPVQTRLARPRRVRRTSAIRRPQPRRRAAPPQAEGRATLS